MGDTSNVTPSPTADAPKPPESAVKETDSPTPPRHPAAIFVALICALALFAAPYLLATRDTFYEALAIFLCTVFLQGALRRYYKYRLEVQQLIEGRLEKVKEETSASKDPATAAKQMETLVALAGKLETGVGNLKTTVGNLETTFGERLELIERLLRPPR